MDKILNSPLLVFIIAGIVVGFAVFGIIHALTMLSSVLARRVQRKRDYNNYKASPDLAYENEAQPDLAVATNEDVTEREFEPVIPQQPVARAVPAFPGRTQPDPVEDEHIFEEAIAPQPVHEEEEEDEWEPVTVTHTSSYKRPTMPEPVWEEEQTEVVDSIDEEPVMVHHGEPIDSAQNEDLHALYARQDAAEIQRPVEEPIEEGSEDEEEGPGSNAPAVDPFAAIFATLDANKRA